MCSCHVLDSLALLARPAVVDVVVVKVVVRKVPLALLTLFTVDDALSSQLRRFVGLCLVLAAMRTGLVSNQLDKSKRIETDA